MEVVSHNEVGSNRQRLDATSRHEPNEAANSCHRTGKSLEILMICADTWHVTVLRAELVKV